MPDEIGRERELSHKGDLFLKIVCPCGQEVVQTFGLNRKVLVKCATCGRRTKLYASANMHEALAVELNQ